MSYDTEHYYALHTFLEDDELHEIWNIVEKAMNRHGFDVSNSELSMRLYDEELEENMFFRVTQSLYFIFEFWLRSSLLIPISFFTSALVSFKILTESRFELDRLSSSICVFSLKNLTIDSIVSI